MSKQKFSTLILDKLDYIGYMTDAETQEIMYANRALLDILGLHNENEIVGRKCYSVLFGRNTKCEFCPDAKLLTDIPYKWECFNPRLQKYFELNSTVIDLDGKKVKVDFGKDITASKENAEELKSLLTQEETLSKCLQTLSNFDDLNVSITKILSIVCEFYEAERVFIFEFRESRSSVENTFEWCSQTGLPQIQSLQDVSIETMGRYFHRCKKKEGFFISDLRKEEIMDPKICSLIELQKMNSLMITPLIRKNKNIGFIGVVNPKENLDTISVLEYVALFVLSHFEKREMVTTLKEFIYIDPLTGAYNRRKYLQTVNEIIENGKDGIGIIFVSVNGLKNINKKYGQDNGDKVLLKTSNLMKLYFYDNIFRMAGNEFLAIFREKEQEEFEEKVKSFRDVIDKQEDLNLSIGNTWCSKAKEIMQEIAHADEINFINKQDYYKENRFDLKSYRATIAKDLIKAICEGDFVVLLQSKVRLADGKVVGAEALIRKKDSYGGYISPEHFVSIYEEDGIIRYIDFFVLEVVCKTLQKWKAQGYPLLPISVNFSRKTILEFNIAQNIKEICNQYDIDSKYIKIEITENVSNIVTKHLAEIINSIRAENFQVSLDDFGSEYSNLAILNTIDFDEIKLDRSLISNLASSDKNRNVINHIINMCNTFENTATVAEGIETEEQLDILNKFHCAIGQGYFFSRPISIEDFLQYYLKTNNIPEEQ